MPLLWCRSYTNKKVKKPQRLYSTWIFMLCCLHLCLTACYNKYTASLNQGRSLNTLSAVSHKFGFSFSSIAHPYILILPSSPLLSKPTNRHVHKYISIQSAFDLTCTGAAVRFLSCGAAALMPDWEQQV